MKIVAIVQARMGSTRLPGKALKDIHGRTMLARVVRRALRSALIDKLVVATTEKKADDVIVSECDSLGISCFRGSEDDVLDRYYQAARAFSADTHSAHNFRLPAHRSGNYRLCRAGLFR